MDETLKKLQAPFAADEIEWRVDRGVKNQKGNFVYVVPYISNRAIQSRLDDVFGPFGWKNIFRTWKDKSQICGISVKHDDEWITKWDGSDDSNVDAVKGGLSSAMKRAAVQWGIGRYLYKIDQFKVPVQENGNNYCNVKVKSNGKEEYITGYWNTPALPDWALPEKETPGTQNNKGVLEVITGTGGKTDNKDKDKDKTQGDDYCVSCGVKINKSVKTYSEKYYGKPLCQNCQKDNVKIG
jgi:hypothetical protein